MQQPFAEAGCLLPNAGVGSERGLDGQVVAAPAVLVEHIDAVSPVVFAVRREERSLVSDEGADLDILVGGSGTPLLRESL